MKSSKNLCNYVVILLLLGAIGGINQTQAVQTPLPGSAIPQFVDPLPVLDVAGGTIKTLIADESEIVLHMREFKANVMPSTFVPVGGVYTGTWVFGYLPGEVIPTPTPAQATYTGPVIVATRGVPTQIRFVNELGNTATTNVALWKETIDGAIDQTLHWADPLNGEMNMCNHMIMPGMPPSMGCDQHYAGPIPAVVHLHGGDVPPTLDGGPDAWFTSDGLYHGHGYYTDPTVLAAGNEAVYRYPNAQEAAPIWFHDHLLGGTRINVYCGLAGAYDLIDPALVLPTGLHPVGLQQGVSGPVDLLIPLVIQDRMFDTTGQLYFPNIGLNPEHPYWVPEFVGDTILVNGKVWPFLNVQAKRYRFLIVNGSNARTYELFFVDPVSKANGPAIWQIATDGGYLDKPVKLDPALGQKLTLMPGERADIIVDFTGKQGQTLLLRNTGRTPYPKGAAPNGNTLGRIMQFRVQAGVVADASYNPATLTALRPAMVRLANPATGTLAPGVVAAKTRQMTLNEVMGMPMTVGGIAYPGGPLEILVNNTKWDGKRGDGTIRTDFNSITLNGVTNYYSELPNEGDTEIWEIVNLTADAHPMHTHLIQFQLMNRQNFNTSNYNKAYAAAFPGGLFIPAYGPPLNYATGNPRALGGNPNITPFLQGGIKPPLANEAGWKDTIMCPPGMVTRFVARFAPQDKAVNALDLNYAFDPNALGYGYVWHCHIVDHEDNEMMRPYKVVPKEGVIRTYIQGTDY
jgi:FtsP/CotA-like multicopper oxidase with cupredoxin domain